MQIVAVEKIVWCSGACPTGECILLVLDLCWLFWHYLYGGRLYCGHCNARYVCVRTVSVPPDLHLFLARQSCGRCAPFSLQPIGPRLWLKHALLGLLVFFLSSLSPTLVRSWISAEEPTVEFHF